MIHAAVGAALGRSLLEWLDNSVLNSCMPPTLRTGKTAMAMTMIPMPPSHWSNARQSNIPMAVSLRLLIVVEPVVVRPDIASKNAPANLISGIDRKIGKLAYRVTVSQLTEVKINASLMPKVSCVPLAPSTKAVPENRVAAAEIRK